MKHFDILVALNLVTEILYKWVAALFYVSSFLYSNTLIFEKTKENNLDECSKVVGIKKKKEKQINS